MKKLLYQGNSNYKKGCDVYQRTAIREILNFLSISVDFFTFQTKCWKSEDLQCHLFVP